MHTLHRIVVWLLVALWSVAIVGLVILHENVKTIESHVLMTVERKVDEVIATQVQVKLDLARALEVSSQKTREDIIMRLEDLKEELGSSKTQEIGAKNTRKNIVERLEELKKKK